MRRSVLVAATAALLAASGCGGAGPGQGSESSVPSGYERLGAVDGAPVYAEVSADGFTIDVRIVDDEVGCEGSTPLIDGLLLTQVCNTQTPDTYAYAAALPKNAITPRLCDARSGEPAAGTRLEGPADWTVDLVVAVGHKPSYVMPCPGENLLREKDVTPSPR